MPAWRARRGDAPADRSSGDRGAGDARQAFGCRPRPDDAQANLDQAHLDALGAEAQVAGQRQL
jgi:hypothetical protein